MSGGRKALDFVMYGTGGDPICDDLSDGYCTDYHCAGDCGLAHNQTEAIEHSLAHRAEKAERQLQFLLFDLWRDGILTEQQCATYRDVDLVSLRGMLDTEAQNRGFRDRIEAQS